MVVSNIVEQALFSFVSNVCVFFYQTECYQKHILRQDALLTINTQAILNSKTRLETGMSSELT